MRKPLLIVLVGLPGLGKSTWREKFLRNHDFDGFVASTDDLIEEYAEERNSTYSAVFNDAMPVVNDLFDKVVHLAFSKRKDLIIDRTNMNAKSRSKFVRRAKNAGYEIRAIVFQAPVTVEDRFEYKRRLASRPGKVIPDQVIIDMTRKYEAPTAEEGFDFIGIIDTFMFPETLQVVYDSSMS
jgi:predicted kinase